MNFIEQAIRARAAAETLDEAMARIQKRLDAFSAEEKALRAKGNITGASQVHMQACTLRIGWAVLQEMKGT